MNAMIRREYLAPMAITIVLAAAAGTCGAADVDYERDVKPILRAKCYACHGGLKQEGSLRVDTAVSAVTGGDSGEAIVPGDPDASLLWERISTEDESYRMPIEGSPLDEEQLAIVKAWIEQGAKGPADEQPEADPRDHWAFQLPVRSPVPATSDPEWIRNPIDAFIAAQHEQRGLTHAPEASPEILLRRVHLDLVGLPPTREQLTAFRQDDSQTAYENAVDRLLDSEQYGQRWARHWMDVWRYSDWYGRRMVPDVWNSAPQVWRWRDWIVNSLNNDKGYDRMIVEMLAADEVDPGNDESVVATAYLARNWFALNPNEWMRDNVEYTAKSFLGLTFNCAHCHDHKYDPIAQDEYFALRAFFEPIGMRQDRVPGEPDPGLFQPYEYSVLRKIQRLGLVRVYDESPDAPTWFYTGGDERNRVEDRGSIEPRVPEAIGGRDVVIEPIELPPEAYYPGLRPAIQAQERNEHSAALATAEAALEAARQAAEDALTPLREQFAAAQNAYDAAAAASGSEGALQGRQSLQLDATEGRRILHNPLSGLTAVEDGATLRFQMKILADAHANFQLVRDVNQALTAGFVAFENGKIISYQPGGYDQFNAGTYDFEGGQDRFEVVLLFEPSTDRCLLSVKSLSDDALLVDKVPVALNGWNPRKNAAQPITFDARTGSKVAFDVLTWTPAGADAPEVSFDFESEAYVDGNDVLGVDEWSTSSYSVAPATSRVSKLLDGSVPSDAVLALQIAQNAVAAQELSVQAAEANVEAAQRKLDSLEARIAADRARYGIDEGIDAAAAARTAVESERKANHAAAAATLLAKQHALAQAKALPATDAERAKKIETAQTEVNTASSAEETARNALAAIEEDATYTPLSPVYASTSTGRRKALAEWIASPANPLTARVAVNHIWMRHFHSPLVASVFDFGNNGADPTHPQLLDWLAVELMESGWSMKHLHRLIVTSAAYRQSSSAAAISDAGGEPSIAENLRIDPDNHFLWRMNVGRMESEVVRDSILWCAGNLDLTLGGQELENSEALTTTRRSLYYSTHPEAGGKSELGMLFDAADAAECYRRTRSVIPQQALALTNSELIHKQSAELAARFWAGLSADEQSDPSAFVTAAFETILSRPPSDAETELCSRFLQEQTELLAGEGTAEPAAAARTSLVRSLFSHNDFLAIR
ncbi:MAG: DUF1553 domain-containing protein [Planctomycetota bacterium]|nr:MAG: DUF1553 domain-containing protein [Planctomycetota bacterium]REK38608.1 MAG: DUF1553 domain-containing protein [Planctomycetota bacterium]